MSEYTSIFSIFETLEPILEIHTKLLDFLYLLKSTLEVIDDGLGNIYSFSEFNMLLNIQQAFEVTVSNGYFKANGTAGEMAKFENMVFYNLFHQLYSTLRKDHQNVFQFVYANFLLKYTEQFNEDVYDLFLSGEIGNTPLQSLFM